MPGRGLYRSAHSSILGVRVFPERAAHAHACTDGPHAEPVAAAMAYGFGKVTASDTLLVVDLGGGTLDVSILDAFEGITEVT